MLRLRTSMMDPLGGEQAESASVRGRTAELVPASPLGVVAPTHSTGPSRDPRSAPPRRLRRRSELLLRSRRPLPRAALLQVSGLASRYSDRDRRDSRRRGTGSPRRRKLSAGRSVAIPSLSQPPPLPPPVTHAGLFAARRPWAANRASAPTRPRVCPSRSESGPSRRRCARGPSHARCRPQTLFRLGRGSRPGAGRSPDSHNRVFR